MIRGKWTEMLPFGDPAGSVYSGEAQLAAFTSSRA